MPTYNQKINTYFVAKSGSDSNNGRVENYPFLTLTAAVNAANAIGQPCSVTVLDGKLGLEYPEIISPNVDLVIDCNGATISGVSCQAGCLNVLIKDVFINGNVTAIDPTTRIEFAGKVMVTGSTPVLSAGALTEKFLPSEIGYTGVLGSNISDSQGSTSFLINLTPTEGVTYFLDPNGENVKKFMNFLGKTDFDFFDGKPSTTDFVVALISPSENAADEYDIFIFDSQAQALESAKITDSIAIITAARNPQTKILTPSDVGVRMIRPRIGSSKNDIVNLLDGATSVGGQLVAVNMQNYLTGLGRTAANLTELEALITKGQELDLAYDNQGKFFVRNIATNEAVWLTASFSDPSTGQTLPANSAVVWNTNTTSGGGFTGARWVVLKSVVAWLEGIFGRAVYPYNFIHEIPYFGYVEDDPTVTLGGEDVANKQAGPLSIGTDRARQGDPNNPGFATYNRQYLPVPIVAKELIGNIQISNLGLSWNVAGDLPALGARVSNLMYLANANITDPEAPNQNLEAGKYYYWDGSQWVALYEKTPSAEYISLLYAFFPSSGLPVAKTDIRSYIDPVNCELTANKYELSPFNEDSRTLNAAPSPNNQFENKNLRVQKLILRGDFDIYESFENQAAPAGITYIDHPLGNDIFMTEGRNASDELIWKFVKKSPVTSEIVKGSYTLAVPPDTNGVTLALDVGVPFEIVPQGNLTLQLNPDLLIEFEYDTTTNRFRYTGEKEIQRLLLVARVFGEASSGENFISVSIVKDSGGTLTTVATKSAENGTTASLAPIVEGVTSVKQGDEFYTIYTNDENGNNFVLYNYDLSATEQV